MEYLETRFLVLKKNKDKLMNVTFVTGISENQVISIKLPTNIENYKQGFLISPYYILELELVKTRKNWVLKNITNFTQIFDPKKYSDHEKISQIINILNKFVHEDQEINLIDFLQRYFKGHLLTSFDMTDFESELLERLGFSPTLKKQNLTKTLKITKQQNDLKE